MIFFFLRIQNRDSTSSFDKESASPFTLVLSPFFFPFSYLGDRFQFCFSSIGNKFVQINTHLTLLRSRASGSRVGVPFSFHVRKVPT